MAPKLYSVWRSSAAFRVRIVLNLEGMDYETIPVHLSKNGGEQMGEVYGHQNPNRLVPLLEIGEKSIHQSLAIIEYLKDTQAEPALLPKLAIDRAWVRSLAMDITNDIHSINNLRVLRYLIKKLDISNEAKDEWYRHWIQVGLESIEKQLSKDSRVGRFAYGDGPGLIDVCLVPQIFNALSSQVDVGSYPTLMRIFDKCMKLPAFIDASWEKQMDAEGLNPTAPPPK
ncbi:maleylacetoacetate isomerase [Polynucleobacter necessarius]|uniref:maleylacetoacetate isomerase n=1 Tax=Polynucleobacter necessarius TaxID=576610 RepID=UPI000E094AA3|nr:maleylacetoacetate isomerase [Polynucleobacter necessarius]